MTRALMGLFLLLAAGRLLCPILCRTGRHHQAPGAHVHKRMLRRSCKGIARFVIGQANLVPSPWLTYEETRPWAMAMKLDIQSHKMPPWFADPHYGKFSNAMSLRPAEIDTLSKWPMQALRKAIPRTMPAAVEWVEGWGIGKPDAAVYQLPVAYDVPASGVIDYQHVIVPTGFTEDRWIQAAEVRPTARSVVHHIIAFVRRTGIQLVPRAESPASSSSLRRSRPKKEPDTSALPSDFLGRLRARRSLPKSCGPAQAKLIKAGSDIIFSSSLHAAWTRYARSVPPRHHFRQKRASRTTVLTLSATNGTFKIPPGHPNYRVDSSFEVATDVKLSGLHPHMHGRRQGLLNIACGVPGGESRTILSVPHYDWHWQNWYNLERPIALPKGARIDCTRTLIISPNNPENADPTKEVIWGEQSWDEMMVGSLQPGFRRQDARRQLFPDKKKQSGHSQQLA